MKKLTNQQIQSFIEYRKKDFGETLSPEVAESEATRLLDFFSAMQQMLRSHKNEETLEPESLDERADIKEAWERTMRRR